MKEEDKSLCHLPKRRTGLRVEWLASWPMWLIGLFGLGMYVMLVIIISGAEWFLAGPCDSWIKAADGSVVGFWDIIYFNFISILTIGYGDYSPNSDGARFITILEAIVGTGILGFTLAALTAKFLSPPKNAIVFSRYAYYCTEEEKILVIYLNTSRSRLVNTEISSYFKLGGDWEVRPSVRSPFVTRAVQTFFTDFVPEARLVALLNEASDAFRFAVSGELGVASLSVGIEYKPSDIIVIPNREPLTTYPGFWDVDFHSPELERMFHYRPASAHSLSEHVEMRRRPLAGDGGPSKDQPRA